MTKIDLKSWSDRFSYWSLFSLSLFLFTSLALISLSHLLILFPIGFCLWHIKDQVPLPRSSICLLVLSLICVVSILFAPDIQDPWKKASQIRYFLFAVGAIWAFNGAFDQFIDRSKIKLLLTVFIVTVSIANIDGLIALASGYNILRGAPTPDIFRSTGMYNLAMTYGYGIQFAVLGFFGLWLNRKRVNIGIDQRLILLALISSGLGLYFSYTRGALLGLLAGFPFLFYRRNKKLFWRMTAIAAGLALVGVVIAFVSSERVENRFFLSANNESNLLRISQYKAAWKAFTERPLMGVGHNNFKSQSIRIKRQYGIERQDFESHSHNNFLEFLASTGIFGFLAFVLFQFFWFIEARQRSDEWGDLAMATVVAFAVSGMFQVTALDAENTFFVMLLYTLTHVKHRNSTKNS